MLFLINKIKILFYKPKLTNKELQLLKHNGTKGYMATCKKSGLMAIVK